MPGSDNGGTPWKKSTYSAAQGCVEIRVTPSSVLIRDSKDPGGPILEVSHDAWRALLDAVRSGEFNRD